MRTLYTAASVKNCPQHVEAKKLANKFFTQMQNLERRYWLEGQPAKLADKLMTIESQLKEVNSCILKHNCG